ncbi:putative ferric-chelate reductase 1-like protein [Leptotrombidium deliense]|uniref:Putative ferric-chelate reductase 1-like protein n=1 Tax=Leptotrombidium deliense TaxID=299467 RepID=A0A443SFE6_9ACAR|nr:putative ferric-chelate reductase 1-like protein [Leptotrombidium deliense]
MRILSQICVALLCWSPFITGSVKCQIPEYVYSGCAENKTCIGLGDCVSTKNCPVVAIGRPINDVIEFELYGDISKAGSDHWFAMGLSLDTSMGDDSVTDCIYQKDKNIAVHQESYNTGHSNALFKADTDKSISNSIIDKYVKCVWQRNMVTTVKGNKYDLNSVYILVAHGPATGLNKQIHIARNPSVSTINFNTFAVVESAGVHFLIKMHGSFVEFILLLMCLFYLGILMVTVWCGLVSIAIMIARHYKPLWEEQTLLGEKVWFTLHRGIMATGILLAIIAMIAIFVHFSFRIVTVHSYFGVVTNTLMILQPIGAYFRCHPGTDNRWMFNWGHWAGGNVAQLCAIIAMFLAAYLPAASLPDAFLGFLIFFLVLHLMFHLIMQIHHWYLKSKNSKGNSTEL